jgi:hypothetical protein
MFKEYLDEIYERYGTTQTMFDMVDLVSEAMERVHSENPALYKDIVHKLEKYLYDIPLEEAQKIVSGMRNEYDSVGERWSYEQICDVATQFQLPETINRIELYIVMNMWATDYHRTMKHFGLEDKIESYIMFSCDWLTDCDFGEGKVYKYFIKIKEEDE